VKMSKMDLEFFAWCCKKCGGKGFTEDFICKETGEKCSASGDEWENFWCERFS